MSKTSSTWRDADVWYSVDDSNRWVAGTVVEVQENNGVWKFSIRPLELDAGVVTLWPQCSSSSSHKFSTSHIEFKTLKRRNLQEASSVHDLTKVHGVSEPEVERILSERFLQHQFYTEVGPVLLYLNYWGDLDDPGSSGSSGDEKGTIMGASYAASPTLQQVFEAGERHLLHQVPPHPYKLAEKVYRAMNLDAQDAMRRENQTILLTGESGSGKTRNLQYLLEYLAFSSCKVARQAGVLFAYDTEIEDLVLAANVITSSFGCATTHEGNPSSSRFGKYMELCYSELGFLEGCQLRTFLLESGRVTSRPAHQRNFNVFAEVAAGLHPYEKADFGFHVSPEFRYLGSEYTSVEGLQLEQERHTRNYGRLRQAMTNVGMSPLRQTEAIKVLIGILHVGNITFEKLDAGSDSEGSGGTSSEEKEGEEFSETAEGVTFSESCAGHVEFSCKILGFSVGDLCAAITSKTSKVSGRAVVTRLGEEAAVKVRDTLARTLYHSLFKWIVVEINRALSENMGECSASYIGILDIFGLDSTDNNQLGQMCQNYANEILQCHFFSVVLDGQTKLFEEETGQWVLDSKTAVNVDSGKHIDLFESQFCGIFPILNTVMHSAIPSEDQFMTILRKSNAGNPLLIFDNKSNKRFTIRHYAYNVTYSVENVIEMNQGLREINFATLSTSTSGKEFRFSTDNTGGSRRMSSGSTAGGGGELSPARRISRGDTGGSRSISRTPQRSPGSLGSKTGTPPQSDKSKYKKVKTSVHKKQSIAHTFVTEINELVAQIKTTRSHFLQCVKSSLDVCPEVYEPTLVTQQLRYCSVMKSIAALQCDLSLKMPYSAFLSEYSCLLYVARKGPVTAGVFKSLATLQERPKHPGSLKSAALGIVEVIPLIGSILGQIEHNPSFVLTDQHCYDGFEFSDTFMRFSAETLTLVEALKRSTINIIATRVQRMWKAHRLMQFKRFAHARGQHALVFIADLRFSTAQAQHTSAVVIQRRVRVHQAVSLRLRTLAERARKAELRAAAVLVQAFARCHMARKSYARERIQGLAYAKMMTILGCEGDDLADELVLFHYQMDILKTQNRLEKQIQ